MYCTFKKMEFVIKWWDGEHFPLFAYDTETPLIVEGITPEYVIGSVYSSGNEVYLLKRGDVARFFQVNAGSKMWLHNAPFDLAVTQKLLTGSRHLYKTRSVLTQMVEDERVFDTGLIYQLQVIAQEGMCPKRWALDLLVEMFCHEHVDKGAERVTYGQYLQDGIVDYDAMTDGHLQYSAKDAIVTFALAKELMQGMADIDPYNRLLSHQIQLKAAIVLHEMQNTPVHIDQDRVKKLRNTTQKRIDELIDVMSRFGYNEHQKSGKKRRYTYIITELEKELGVVVSFEGSEEAQTKKKSKQLNIGYDQFDMFAEGGIAEPYLNKSQKEEDLEEIKDHPFVCAFLEHQHLKKLITTFINPACEKAEFYPKWTTLVATGRTACSAPNMQNLPRQGGFRECIVPAKGKVFVGADYSFIELCTLAQLLYWSQGSSSLMDAINSGVDPHYNTASKVLAKKLGDITKDERQSAKALNFGIPGGLSAKTLVGYAKSTYQVDLTESEAEMWREGLLSTYPDLATYLEMTEPTCVLPTGRVRGQCSYTTAHNTPFQALAADGAKLSLWEMYKQQATITLFIHDEIIIEVDDNQEAINKAEKLLTSHMLYGMSLVVPNVTVKAEPFAMNRWLKAAEEERDEEGNLIVVTEERLNESRED